MATVGTEIDKCRSKLHDSGNLWTRAELLRWFNDCHKLLIGDAGSVIRPLILDVPGRQAYSITHPWEDRHVSGTFNEPFESTGNHVCTTLWEVEHLGGITPGVTLDGMTYQWERAYSRATDTHFRFALPKEHDRIVRVAFDDKLLLPIEVRELDHADTRWMKNVGRLDWWTTGTGRINTIEIYEISTTYVENYVLQNYESGTPRLISGSRSYSWTQRDRTYNNYGYTSYGDVQELRLFSEIDGLGWRFTKFSTPYDVTQTWESEVISGAATFTVGSVVVTYWWEAEYVSLSDINFFVGLVRRIDSPDRQYVPVMMDWGATALGAVRDWKSSENSLLFHQVIVPDGDLDESDELSLVPSQLSKYIRFHTLARAFGRSGEGQNLNLSQIYEAKWKRGLKVFEKLGNVAFKDMVYVRQDTDMPMGRSPRVRLPSNFPRVW